MNPMDVWNLITVDPTNFVREFRTFLHNISFEVWMRSLGGVIALLGLAMQAKTMMIAADARAFVPVLMRVMLVAILVIGQQDLRIKAEGWYGTLYRWGQGIIRTEATKSSDTISSLSVTLGLIGIGWAGYKAGTAMASAKGANLSEITLAGKEGAVKMVLGAGQFIFALLLPIYMAYYLVMLLAGITVTAGIAVLPFVAALALVPGVGGTSALVSTTRALVTTFFLMVFIPHIFNLCLSVSWNAPAHVVDEALKAAWDGMVTAWNSYSVNLGIPGVDQAATVGNLILSGDGMARVGQAVIAALLALIGGIAMIVIGLFTAIQIIRSSERIVSNVVGGIVAGAAGGMGLGDSRSVAAQGAMVIGGAATAAIYGAHRSSNANVSSPPPRSRGGPLGP